MTRPPRMTLAIGVLMGYTQRPSGIQLLFYAAAIIGIGAGMRWQNRPRAIPRDDAAA